MNRLTHAHADLRSPKRTHTDTNLAHNPNTRATEGQTDGQTCRQTDSIGNGSNANEKLFQHSTGY